MLITLIYDLQSMYVVLNLEISHVMLLMVGGNSDSRLPIVSIRRSLLPLRFGDRSYGLYSEIAPTQYPLHI